jgi:hypothetical protein
VLFLRGARPFFSFHCVSLVFASRCRCDPACMSSVVC